MRCAVGDLLQQLLPDRFFGLGCRRDHRISSRSSSAQCSTGRNTATEDKFAKAVLPGTFNLGFTAALMHKDIKLFLAEREALGVPTDIIEAVERLFQLTFDECGANADLSAVVLPVEKRAGAKVRAS